MKVDAPADPERFYSALREAVGSREARNDLILGIAGRIAANPDAYESQHLWIIRRGREPVGAALMTPPWSLIIADENAPGAAAALAAHINAQEVHVPGVIGNRPVVDHFVEAWTDRVPCSLELVMSLGVFALDAVRSVPSVGGNARPARASERELLVAWVDAFMDEAFAGRPPGSPAETVDNALRATDGDLWVWEIAGAPVSLSGYGRPTPSGIRIGPVYTPPEHRESGYATALVAEQSAWLLEQGHGFCFLNTDLANPTSNSIYERIGYEQVAESAQYRFVDQQ